MSNDKLAGNTNGNGFVRCPRLGNRVLEHLASTLMQILIGADAQQAEELTL